jgi:hypothetical protein
LEQAAIDLGFIVMLNHHRLNQALAFLTFENDVDTLHYTEQISTCVHQTLEFSFPLLLDYPVSKPEVCGFNTR